MIWKERNLQRWARATLIISRKIGTPRWYETSVRPHLLKRETFRCPGEVSLSLATLSSDHLRLERARLQRRLHSSSSDADQRIVFGLSCTMKRDYRRVREGKDGPSKQNICRVGRF